MTTNPFDFSQAQVNEFENTVIPKGTIAKIKVAFKRPDVPMVQGMPLVHVGKTGSKYLSAEITVLDTLDGKNRGRKFCQLIGIESSPEALNIAMQKLSNGLPATKNGKLFTFNPSLGTTQEQQMQDMADTFGNMGKSLIKSIIASQRGFDVKDTNGNFVIRGHEDLEEKPFVVSIGVDENNEDQNGNKSPKNRIGFVVFNSKQEYKTLMGTGAVNALPQAPAGGFTPAQQTPTQPQAFAPQAPVAQPQNAFSGIPSAPSGFGL